jgi:hypothetical protein
LVTAFLSLSCAEQTVDNDTTAANDITKKFSQWNEDFDGNKSV